MTIRAGVLAVNKSEVDEITLAELPGHAEFIHKARGVVENQRNVSQGRPFEDCRVKVIPIRPVNIDFEIPILGRAVRKARHDELRKAQRSMRRGVGIIRRERS